MAASSIYGHVAPMRAIAADLVERGHRVTFATGRMFREYVAGTGASFVPFDGVASFDIGRVNELFPERASIPAGPEQFAFDLQKIFTDTIPDQYRTLQRVFAELGEEPFVLLQETAFWGAQPLRLGAPGLRPTATIGIGVTPLTLSSVDHGPFGPGLPPDSSPEGRIRNRAANEMVQTQLFGAAQAHFVRVVRDLGATEAPPFLLDGIVKLPDRFLQLTIPGMEYPRSDAPAGLRFVGALPPISQRSAALPSWWSDVLTAERVVVVTQGTVTNHDFGELIEPTLRALADLDALVVATLGRPATLTDVPANARVAEFVPYDQLLPHTDVLVGNGGYGGVQQALGQGVPLVLAGLGEDKGEINARAAWTGAAVNLATQRPEPDQIRKAVEAVLDTPSYREHARRLRAEYAGHDPFTAIAESIDELLAAERE